MLLLARRVPDAGGRTNRDRMDDSGGRDGPTAAGVPSTAQLAAAGVARHRVHSAEEQVALPPADELVATLVETIEPGLFDAGFRLNRAGLEVKPRRVHRALDLHPFGDE